MGSKDSGKGNTKENTEKYDRDNIVIGRNAVLELLKSGRQVESIVVSNGAHEGSVNKIIAMANEAGITVKNANVKKLDYMASGENHQGVIANIPAHDYSTVDDILQFAAEKGEAPFIIICDEIEDSRNLGAVIRTAEACGAHGVIITKRRGAGLNFITAKAACGALEYMRVARVSNITSLIKTLKENNIWVYAADMGGTNWKTVDYSGGVALVIGNEGRGISRLVKENCDVTVGIPMYGNLNSINVSVAAGIIMYEIASGRKG